MILTITLNPSIDRRYDVKDFEKGKIFRTNEYQYTAGGKGINVTKVINIFGDPVLATGFLGGRNGTYIIDKLAKMNIENDFIFINGETRSCINIASSDGGNTEILESGPTIDEEELNKFYQLYDSILDKCNIICASGSLPDGLPVDIYNELIKRANKKEKKFILDTSGEPLAKGIIERPYLIKPNKEELSKLIGRNINSEEDIIRGVKNFIEGGIEVICISLGDKGALVFNNGYMYRVDIPKVEVMNTVGSGDSMVAGFAVSLLRGYDFESMLRLSSACGTANAMELETGKVDLDNVDKLINRIKIEKIKI